jgi:hypothetical protein
MAYIFRKYVKIEKIHAIVDEHFEDSGENADMKKVVDDIMHHHLMDLVLDSLDETKRTHFLANVDNDITHDSLLSDLHEWIEDFEAKIHSRIQEVEKEILALLKD